jgi:hypothetical protein
VLNEYWRVLRTGGGLFVTVKAGDDRGEWVETEWGQRWFHFWSDDMFDELLDWCGFEIVGVDDSESGSSTTARSSKTWVGRYAVAR